MQLEPFVFSSIWNRENRRELNLMHQFMRQFDGSRLLEVSYNLFPRENANPGSISIANGNVNDDGFFNTGFVALEPNTTYTTTGKGAGALYGPEQNFIRGIGSTTTQFTTSSNEYFFRATLGGYQIDTFMIYEGTDVKPYKEGGVIPAPLILAPELQAKIDDAMGYFDDFDILTVNKGADYPLKSVKLGSQSAVSIPAHVRDVILDAKVEGGKADMYYRVSFIANGIVQGEAPRYGITAEEIRRSTGARVRTIFVYNDRNTPENNQNYNITKSSDGIDTLIADNGEIAISLTIDRAVISASSNPTFLNLNTGIGASPSAIIDPATYTSF